MVVLPQPGGPHRIIEASCRLATMRPIGPSAPIRWSWPRMSPRLCGRSRSASGRGAWVSNSVVIDGDQIRIVARRAALQMVSCGLDDNAEALAEHAKRG